jgi:hypothetical protein
MRKRVAVCFICDGGTEEEAFSGEFVRIAVHGFTMLHVEANPPWTYTIGLLQSYDHPELVMTGQPPDMTAELLTDVVEHIRQGERYDGSSAPLALCDCTSVAFGPVHAEQWTHGRFNQWLNYYDRLGEEPPVPDAVQVLWPMGGLFPPDPEFCTKHRGACQPLLDREPRHDVHTGLNREQRRQAKRGHGKRRRP